MQSEYSPIVLFYKENISGKIAVVFCCFLRCHVENLFCCFAPVANENKRQYLMLTVKSRNIQHALHRP